MPSQSLPPILYSQCLQYGFLPTACDNESLSDWLTPSLCLRQPEWYLIYEEIRLSKPSVSFRRPIVPWITAAGGIVEGSTE